MGSDDERTEGEARAEAGTATGAPARAEAGAKSAGEAGGEDVRGSAASATATADRRRLRALLSNCERSALYHKAREGFLGSCHRWVMFLVLLSSSSAALTVARYDEAWGWMLAFVPALLGATDMTLAFGQQARDHAILARRFLDLAADALEDGVSSVSLFEGRFYRVCSEEPPTFKALDALCHNQVCDALGVPGQKQVVPRIPRFFRHLLRYSGKTFSVVSEKK